MSVINTNISALSAQASLRRSAIDSSTSMERLSTGIRINSAKDDAAGLAISTRMTANIRGMAAAIRNSNDGISLTQTAEGSLSAIQNNLQRIRELAVQSANSGNSQSDRNSLNLEAQQMITEIDRVAANSAFNGSKLLDGTFKDQSFQVGSGNDTTDRISISIGNAKASALGVVGATTGTSSAAIASGVTSGALAAGDLAINGFAIAATSTDGVSSAFSETSAIAKANSINASSSLTGVTAKAEATTQSFTITTGTAASGQVAAGSLLINGVDIGALSTITTATDTAPDRVSQLVAAINAKTSQTGVSAANGGTGETNKLVLTASDGRNITTTSSGAAGLGSITSTTAFAKVTLTSQKGTASVDITGSTAAGKLAMGFASTATSQALTASTVTGQTVSSVDLSTQANSQKALSILDAAIDTVTNSRANLGAYQNRFEAAISNLETTSTNLQASRSRILDTDYAKETTNLAKSQIVQQAATAMLAQANQSSQSVLALLK
jgi:flagellin